MTLSFVYTCDTVSFIMQYDVITYQKFIYPVYVCVKSYLLVKIH